MRSPFRLSGFALAAAIAFTTSPSIRTVAADEPKPLVRELFVPFADLDALLEGQPQRVLLSRQQYEDLLKKAKKAPEGRAPQGAALVAAEYAGWIEQERARFTGRLVADVLEDGLHAIPLEMSGVAMRSAALDGKPAAIGRGGDDRLMLLVEGKGRHELVLEMVCPLETTAARQALSFRLPYPGTGRLQLTVPGDVEVRSGATVVSRVADQAAGVTRFELLPRGGDTVLVMTLNSRLLRRQRVVVARSVLVDEVTQAYERLHATVSLAVLHQAVDRFRFVVPEGFEMTEVTSPRLARWAVEKEGPRKVLDVRLREPTTETVVLSLSAVRSPAPLDKWELPKLEPLEVVGQMAVVGLVVEDRLAAESLASKGLIAVDTSVLNRAIPASVLRAEPGAPTLRPVAAYYAPQGDFALSARFTRPPVEMAVTANVLLTLEDRGLKVRGGFLLTPAVEKLFGLEFSAPGGWHVTAVTGPDGKPLAFERYGPADQPGRVRVYLPQGVPPSQDYRVYFEASHTPAAWLAEGERARGGKPVQVAFPVFAVAGATRDVGAVAVLARDDLIVRPDALKQLTPLDESEKDRYGLTGVATSLAYRYESQPYQAGFSVERTQPRLTARTFSFVKVEPDALVAHYELIYRIEEARTRRLSLLLPADTPAAMAIRGLDNVGIKEFGSEQAGAMRRWNVLLEEPRRGTVRLAVDFQKPLTAKSKGLELLKGHALPLVQADRVAYQSGLVAVEGSAELEVQVDTQARRVHVGETVDAEYQPGRRLLGVFAFVDAPKPGAVTIDVSRHPAYGLYPAIVQKALFSTRLSTAGVSHTEAVFELRNKDLYLEVVPPEGSEVWSVLVDDKPVKPQREGESILVSVPAAPVGSSRMLRIVYETPVSAVGLVGEVDLPGPTLRLRAEPGVPGVEVPLVNLQWHLFLPSGYEVVRSRGTVVGPVKEPEPAVVTVAKGIGGLALFRPEWRMIAAKESARGYWTGSMAKSAAKSAAPAAAKGDVAGSPDAAAEPAVETAEPGIGKEEGTEHFEFAAKHKAPARDPAKSAEMPRPGAQPGGPAGMGMPGGRPAAGYGLGAAPGTPKTSAQPPVTPGLTPPPAPPVSGPAKPADKTVHYTRGWKGRSSLKIQLDERPEADTEMVAFQSLGVEPRLVVTLAHRQRFALLGWSAALTVGLIGLALSRRRGWIKLRYIVLVSAIATLLPLVPGWRGLALPGNMAVYAAALLVPYYLLAALARWFFGLVEDRKSASRAAAAGAATIALLGIFSAAAQAQPPQPKTGPYVIQVVEPPEPVKVPEDAVILPYDPDSQTGIREARQMLVPYAKYVELWNLAYPDKRLEIKPPVLPYGLAGGSYAATLQGEEFLVLEGQMQIDVFSDQMVAIPLGLAGGVLTRAELDGRPAKLSVAQAVPPPNQPNPPPAPQPAPQAANPANPPASVPPPPPGGALVVLHVSGKGHHKLALTIRMKVERRGGWRVIEGMLPTAPATALAITIPAPQTDVRLGELADRRSYETEKPGERIDTAVGFGGRVNVQWRPKVGEGQVDRTLTAQSAALLDVQEDGLRLVWDVTLQFRRGQRESFTFHVPAEYLVEKVEGTNVRGWEVRKEEKRQTVEVSLLKAAKESEQVKLRLWRAGAVGEGPLAEFEAPVVAVADAALQTGQLTLRRSPLLEVRTLGATGLSRTDLSAKGPEAAGATAGAGTEDSPLSLRPYEAYQFSSTAFALRLAAAALQGRVTAEVQMTLKIADYERGLDARVKLDAERRPIHRVELFLPEGLKLDHVSVPGEFQWALGQQEKRPLLTVYLASGRLGEVPVLLRGKLARPEAADRAVLPVIEVRNAARQQGDIAVQTDPVYEVRTEALEQIESVLRDRLRGWLKPEQAQVTTLALHYERPGYRGTLRLVAKKPLVTCQTVTNVRVTDRAVEETILLDFQIEQAGIRQLAFVLPASMSDSRIEMPMLRQKTVEPFGKPEDALVRFRLELQDEVMHKFRVSVQNDRLLTAQGQTAPIPVVQTGDTKQQFVALESAGRDEVKVESAAGLEPISRQQEAWGTLQGIFRGNFTQAYLVQSGAAKPALRFKTEKREAVRTAGMRIWLAETDLVCDAHGAYRAQTTYRLDNTINQFLEVELPDGATLFAARVAGEPVKPARGSQGTDPRRVRIPLVKTAPGDLDYEVVVKYGGRMSSPGILSRLEFPLVRTVDVQVELSHVRLYLPETHRYFRFGGTMRLVTEDDLVAGKLTYERKKTERLLDTVRQADPFAKVLAASNLKNVLVEDSSRSIAQGRVNEQVKKELDQNDFVIRQAKDELDKLQQAPAQARIEDNRGRMNELVRNQRAFRARNVVKDMDSNFQPGQPAPTGAENPAQLNTLWLSKSQLENAEIGAGKPAEEEFQKRVGGKGKGGAAADQKQAELAKGQFRGPGVAQTQAGEVRLQIDAEELAGVQAFSRDSQTLSLKAAEPSSEVDRYQRRLDQSQMAQQAAPYGGGTGYPSAGRQGAAGGIRSNQPRIAEKQVAAEARRGAFYDESPARRAGAGMGPAPQDQPAMPGLDGLAEGQPLPTGLASLDFELPKRGTAYLLTTPGGDVTVTARAASREFLDGLARAAAVVAAAVLVLWIGRLAAAGLFRPVRGWPAAVVLIAAGFAALLAGFIVAAVVLLAAGIAIAVHWLMLRRQRAATPAGSTAA